MIKTLALILVAALTSCNAWAEPAVHADRAMVIEGLIQGNNLSDVSKALLSKKTGEEADIVINSPGGSILTGFDFISNMEAAKQRGVTINCFVSKIAASMAFQILLHCNNRYVLDRSFLLWHRARVMLGGMSGEPMTAPQLSGLGRDLERTDKLILAEVVKYVDMPADDVRYHFEHETLHIGETLAAECSGSFTALAAVPGLFEALSNPKLPRTKVESPFGFMGMSGLDGDYSIFRFGEIIYVKPANVTVQ